MLKSRPTSKLWYCNLCGHQRCERVRLLWSVKTQCLRSSPEFILSPVPVTPQSPKPVDLPPKQLEFSEVHPCSLLPYTPPFIVWILVYSAHSNHVLLFIQHHLSMSLPAQSFLVAFRIIFHYRIMRFFFSSLPISSLHGLPLLFTSTFVMLLVPSTHHTLPPYSLICLSLHTVLFAWSLFTPLSPHLSYSHCPSVQFSCHSPGKTLLTSPVL
jgi:hypothetical protein